jgi:hypothetical protein
MRDFIDILLLATHLLAMNVASAGPLAAAWLISQRDNPNGGVLARRLLRWSLAALVAGVVTGGAMLAAPSAGLRAALSRFPPSTYWFAGSELAFSAACLVAMLLSQRWLERRPIIAWLTALIAASNLLYHFPPLMAVIGQLASDPRWATERSIPRPVMMRLWARPEILALWAHFALASLAASAIVCLWPLPGSDSNDVPQDNLRFVRCLAAVALVASLLQVPVGVWMLLSAGAPARNAVLGGDPASSASLIAGILAAIALLRGLASIALGESAPAVRRRTVYLLVVTVVLMSATLTISRRAANNRRVEAGEQVRDRARPLAAAPGDQTSCELYFAGSGSFEASSRVPPGKMLCLKSSS